MLVEMLFRFVIGFLNTVFGWVSFPEMPQVVTSAIDELMWYIYEGIGFVWLVVPRGLVLAVLPVILIVENFDRLYSIVMWSVKKIPFLGMQ